MIARQAWKVWQWGIGRTASICNSIEDYRRVGCDAMLIAIYLQNGGTVSSETSATN
jgi:hypothetical protein